MIFPDFAINSIASRLCSNWNLILVSPQFQSSSVFQAWNTAGCVLVNWAAQDSHVTTDRWQVCCQTVRTGHHALHSKRSLALSRLSSAFHLHQPRRPAPPQVVSDAPSGWPAHSRESPSWEVACPAYGGPESSGMLLAEVFASKSSLQLNL